MTVYHAELGIDLGEVGYRNREPFRIRLDASALSDLIGDAQNAHRVYELMLIDRPGDIWGYVEVVVDDASSRVASRVAAAGDQAAPRFGAVHPRSDGRIPFLAFDRLFEWAWDDTEPEDEAWLSHRDSEPMRAFARQMLATARAAQASIDWNDPLLRHVVARVRAGDHPYAFVDRSVSIAKSAENGPGAPSHTDGFYKQLGSLLRDPTLTSIAYRADGDYKVLRMLATEQRRRSNRTGHCAGIALHASALVNRKISNEAWDSEVWFFDEGLAHGDLVIQGCGLGEGSVRGLVEMNGRVPGRYVLSCCDEGGLEGFDAESGDGWVLYRRQRPYSRRVGLELIENRRRSKLGPILKFDGPGATLFDHDKTVVVVGAETVALVRETLAAALAEWQQHGGDPVLIVLGDAAPFEVFGCRDVLRPGTASGSVGDASPQVWLWKTLQRTRPWVDVLIMFDVPTWATEVLARHTNDLDDLSRPWVVATPAVDHINVDLTLEGDVVAVLHEALQRARASRPRVL